MIIGHCRECAWVDGDPDGPNGWCHRYPPTALPGSLESSGFPVVEMDDYCGEFRGVRRKVSPGRSDKEIEKMAEARRLRKRNIEKRFGVKDGDED